MSIGNSGTSAKGDDADNGEPDADGVGGVGGDSKGADSEETSAGEESATPSWLKPILAKAAERGAEKARVARAKFPRKTRFAVGEELVRAAGLRAGLLGAATGTLALITLPVGLPASVAGALFVEAELLFALLALYEFEIEGATGRVRLGVLWAGAGFASAAKSAGLKLGADALGRALAGTLPARLIARLEPALLRTVLERLGLGFIPKMFKLWPILGAPISFVFDRAALRTLGKASLETLERLEVERRQAKAEEK